MLPTEVKWKSLCRVWLLVTPWTHLEPDILECEVKWVLGRITMNKASGGDRIPAELYSNSWNSPSQASTVREPRTSRCYSWILKRQRNQKSNWQHPWDHQKAREYQKNTYFCFIDYTKALTVWITLNCRKFWKRWQYKTTWPASWETYMKVRKQQLELDMEQETGSK